MSSSVPPTLGSRRRSSSQDHAADLDTTDPVYTDNCLVCNQSCLFQANAAGNYEERSLPSVKAALEIRQVFYKAFEIGVDPVDVVNSEDEDGSRVSDLPLCTICTFKLGQLKSIQAQLEVLEKEYRKMRRNIAFAIVDIVASNSGVDLGMSLTDFNNQPADVIVGKMREYEVETLQQLIFEKWHETSYDDDELEEQERLIPIVKIDETPKQTALPSLKKVSLKEVQGNANPKPSTSTKLSSNGTAKTTLISITTKDGGNVKQYGSNRAGESSNAIAKQIYQRLNFRNAPEQPQLYAEDEEEYVMDEESGLEDYEREDSFLGDEQLDQPQSSMGVRGGSSGYPGLEVTEWSGSSDESQERVTDYDGEVDDETLQEFGMSMDGEALPPVRRRRGTADSDALQIDFQQNEDGLFVCMYCNKTFIHKYPFRDHVKTHTGEGPKCPICAKIFPKRHNLMLHLRTHTGEKPYSCAVCNKGFADKSNLKVHMRVHTGERPYKCEYCDLAFVNSSRLVVHKRSHSGEKPHQCDLCSKAFSTSNQLSSHRKVHFDTKKPFSCEECGKGFSNNTSLTAHLGSFHGLGR